MKSLLNGVNLGGWLILEKWLTPSVFKDMDAHDEWGLAQTSEGRRRIKHHRKTFLTEQDFVWLKDHKIEIVRLPVPFWAVITSRDYVSAVKEVDWAMSMAEKYHIKVLLDLHAAPGGQNEGDHSGRFGQMEWFNDKAHQDQTIDILVLLAKRYKDSPVLWGVEIMNEPESRGNVRMLRAFYRRAYRELRQVVRPGTYTVFHDGFRPFYFVKSLRERSGFPVAMDVHWYAFSVRPARSFTMFLALSWVLRAGMITLLRTGQPIIIGEWSTVLPQRYFDVVKKQDHGELLRRNSSMQQRAYSRVLGSMYWNYKAEGEGMWNFRSLVDDGSIDLS